MNLEELLFTITVTSHRITLIILTLMLHLMSGMIVLGCANLFWVEQNRTCENDIVINSTLITSIRYFQQLMVNTVVSYVQHLLVTWRRNEMRLDCD